MAKAPTFYQILTDAINEISGFGTTPDRLAYWQDRLEKSAVLLMMPRAKMEARLREAYARIFRTMVTRGGVLRDHPGVSQFRLTQVQPKLRNELEKAIMTSANLIRLNREQSIQKTLQRFTGWASSIPPGGSKAQDKPEVKANIRKSIGGLPFEERRVLVDQAAKLTSSISQVMALNSGAIAAVWHSNWRQVNYDYREDHKERDQLVYAIRGNWAIEKGFMKSGPAGYSDEITQPAEEVFCRCKFVYIYNLRSLPASMLTKRGEEALAAARANLRNAA